MFSFAALLGGAFATMIRGSTQKWGYYMFAATRFIIGAGESGMISLAYTIVDQLSPPKYKTLYMAAIMMSPPLGIAAGYGTSGLIVSLTRWWQAIFFAESIIVFLLGTLCYWVPFHGYKIKQDDVLITINHVEEVIPVSLSMDVSMSTFADTPDLKTDTSCTPTETTHLATKKNVPQKHVHSILTAIPPLAKNPVYVSIVAVSIVYGAIVGALTFWCPSYLLQRLQKFPMTEQARTQLANLGFAVIVLVSSIGGTALGAIALDKSGGAVGWRGVMRAMFWSVLFIGIALPFGYIVFLIEDMNLYLMFSIFFIGIFFVLCIASPFQVALNKFVHYNKY
jgi:MFS family permease